MLFILQLVWRRPLIFPRSLWSLRGVFVDLVHGRVWFCFWWHVVMEGALVGKSHVMSEADADGWLLVICEL